MGMLELYDVLSTALKDHVPLGNTKYEKSHCKYCMGQIYKLLYQHENDMAILIRVDGKKVEAPKLVQVYKTYSDKVVLRYKTYDNYGGFRGYLTEIVGYNAIYCRQAQIKLFGNI